MNIEAIILAGGRGTRLQSVVSDLPKPLATVAGRPFITYQFDQLIKAGITRVVVSTGYLAEKFAEMIGHKYKELEIAYCQEDEPLGTGGGIRLAFDMCNSEEVIILNGDIYFDYDYSEFIKWHHTMDYDGSLLLTKIENQDRYGLVKKEASRIIQFVEKGNWPEGEAFISVGAYILHEDMLNQIELFKKQSIETEFFSVWANQSRLGGLYEQKTFLDIGTPESFIEANELLEGK